MTPEGKVKAKLRKLLKEVGAYHQAPIADGTGSAGAPDIFALYKGVYFGVEAKATSKNKPRLNQLKHLVDISDQGGAVFVIHDNNIDELKQAFATVADPAFDRGSVSNVDHSKKIREAFQKELDKLSSKLS
jgi:Holliday junction resolvase